MIIDPAGLTITLPLETLRVAMVALTKMEVAILNEVRSVETKEALLTELNQAREALSLPQHDFIRTRKKEE